MGCSEAPEKLMLMYVSSEGTLQALNSTELKPQLETAAETVASETPQARPAVKPLGLRRTIKGFFAEARDLDLSLNGASAEAHEPLETIFEPVAKQDL